MSLGSTIALIKTLAGSGGGGGGGTNVVANPTLAGTEADLTGLQVGDTKYKVGGSSGGGALVVHCDPDTGALDKTWQEIADAYGNSTVVIVSPADAASTGIFYLYAVVHLPVGSGAYRVNFFTITDNTVRSVFFKAQSADDYPVIIPPNP